MTRIGVVSPETMQEILNRLGRQTSSGVRSGDDQSGGSSTTRIDGFSFLNTTGEKIPPYGVFQGYETKNQPFMQTLIIAKKPIHADANVAAIFVNGPEEIGENELGYAQLGPIFRVLHDGTAADGETIGLTDDSFECSEGGSNFAVIGDDDIAENVKLCVVLSGGGSFVQHAYAPEGGIPSATWTAATETMTPGQASCRIATNVDGVYQPSEDETVMVENPVGAVVGASGKPMTIGKNTSGKWTVLVEDCTGTSTTSGGGGPTPDENPEDPVGTIGLQIGI